MRDETLAKHAKIMLHMRSSISAELSKALRKSAVNLIHNALEFIKDKDSLVVATPVRMMYFN